MLFCMALFSLMLDNLSNNVYLAGKVDISDQELMALHYQYNLRKHILSTKYGRCSKITNTFLFLFSNKILVFRAGTHKMLVRIANREDPYQTASEAV